ncbi:MAG: fumarate hydratase [Burkholderiaceae bacterium]
MLATMVTNIRVAEDTSNLLCQDTGIPIYNVVIGSGVEVDGHALKQDPQGPRARDARASLAVVGRAPAHQRTTSTRRAASRCRSSIDFSDRRDTLSIEMVPKGSGSENNSFLKMAIPAEGVDAIKTFVVDCVIAAGARPARRRSSGSASAARRTCAWRSRSARPRASSAAVAATRTARRSRSN